MSEAAEGYPLKVRVLQPGIPINPPDKVSNSILILDLK